MYPEKPVLDLTGVDSNIFMILGLAKRALSKAKFPPEKITEFISQTTSARDYDHALFIVQEWFDVELQDRIEEFEDDDWDDENEEEDWDED